MVATAPTKRLASLRAGSDARAPDLAYFRRRYPETVASLGALPRREEWLRRVWELEQRWQDVWETQGGGRPAEEAIVRGAPNGACEAEGELDVIYVGGAAAILNAAALACVHGRRVLVVRDEEGAGGNWNLSDATLSALRSSGLFTREETDAAVVNRRRGGFVKFYDATSRVKAEPLWVSGALDLAVDGARLTALAAEKLRRTESGGCAVVEGLRFVRAYVERQRVTVEAEGAGGARRFFAARLLVDAGGADSRVARQLNGGRAPARVCPAVGTVARGFARGEADFGVGEILVSTEDACAHRQLFWEGFAGSAARGEYATRLFFYDAVGSPADKSLLALFERYFESLPAYKRRGAGWRVERPLFGYAPAGRHDARGRGRAAGERVILLGDAAGGDGALASQGIGAVARNLKRVARMTHLALEADIADADSLAAIADGGRSVAGTFGLAEFMRPAPECAPSSVNETMNAFVAALAGLDERVRRELFDGRVTLAALARLVARTVRLYPRVIERVRERFGARGTLWWLAGLGEAAWGERRRRAAAARGDGDAPRGEDPAREFARLAAARGDEADWMSSGGTG
jgi:lycopene cyclase CruA